MYSYADGDPINRIDPSGFYSYDPGAFNSALFALEDSGALQGAMDFSAGISNALTLGGAGLIFDAAGASKQINQCSNAYAAGKYSGYALGIAEAGAGLARGGLGGLKALAADTSGAIKWGHGARHLIGTGLSQGSVEAAIAADVDAIAAAGGTGAFWGRVGVQGSTIEYRAYTLADGTINVGTYYIP